MAVLGPEMGAAPTAFDIATLEEGPSLWRYRARSLEIWIPGTILAIIVLACFLWPIIGNVPAPINGSPANANIPMWSPGHPFGTDSVGNDVFSRILYGGRVSIEVGLGANAVGLLLGGLIGMGSAYFGGLVESVIMRVLDVLIAFPALVLSLAVAEYLGPGELHVIWAISFFSVPAFARLARAQTLRLREQTFMLSAKLAGTRAPRTIVAHVAPNVVPQLLTFCFLGISITIILEASLSYLGLGVQVPKPSWGDMIAQGQQYLATNPNFVLVPSTFLLVTVVCINLLGDGIRARLARG